MNKATFKKTALASVVAGTFAAAGVPVAQADVVYVTWYGAFTMLNPTGGPFQSSASDYLAGYYANGNGGSGTAYGPPSYPGNVWPGATTVLSGPSVGAVYTQHGWLGNRTPVSGTMSFDLSNNVGIGTVNPFHFFGDANGSGSGTSVARALGVTFQAVDTFGTIVGSMLFSWNGAGHSVSIVMDGAGMFGALPSALGAFFSTGPTTTISGVGNLAASEGQDFKAGSGVVTYPLGPSPMVTKTTNALGCEGDTLATSVSAWEVVSTGGVAGCTLTSTDSIGGSPMASGAFGLHNANFDIMTIHIDSYAQSPIPVPAAVWLFGSGLVGLAAIARRKKKA